jgi:hypothetical protein
MVPARLHRLFDQAEEKLSAVPGFPSIEPEGEFVQVVLQVLVADGTLVGSEEPAFQQRGHAMYSREKLAGVLPRRRVTSWSYTLFCNPE